MHISYVVMAACVCTCFQVTPVQSAGHTDQEWKDYSVRSIGEESNAAPSLNFNAHRLRNLRITSAYADLYLAKPEAFKWAGLAATVSRDIGLRIAQASISNSTAANIAINIAKKAGWLSPDLDVGSWVS